MRRPLRQVRPTCPPETFVRIGVGIAGAIIAHEDWTVLTDIAGDRLAVPLIGALPAPTEFLAFVHFAIMVAAAALTIAGVLSRLAAAALAASAAWALVWDQQTYSSHQVLLVVLCTLLACSEPGAALSWDARRGRIGRPTPGWPLFLMMTQISVVYAFAALSKLNDVFLSGAVIAATEHFSLPEQILPALAALAVLTEFTLALALWLPGLRRQAVALGLALHLSIVLMLRPTWVLLAFALLCVSVYPAFLTRAGAGAPAQDEPAAPSSHLRLAAVQP